MNAQNTNVTLILDVSRFDGDGGRRASDSHLAIMHAAVKQMLDAYAGLGTSVCA